MKSSSQVNRSGLVTAGGLAGLLFVLLNGERNFSRFGAPESWFGWPFIYYGDGGPGSMELTIYIVPMFINILVDVFIAICALSFLYVSFPKFYTKMLSHSYTVRNISLFLFLFFAIGICLIGEKVSFCCGPRDTLEIPTHIKIGPRFVTNPIG